MELVKMESLHQLCSVAVCGEREREGRRLWWNVALLASCGNNLITCFLPNSINLFGQFSLFWTYFVWLISEMNCYCFSRLDLPLIQLENDFAGISWIGCCNNWTIVVLVREIEMFLFKICSQLLFVQNWDESALFVPQWSHIAVVGTIAVASLRISDLKWRKHYNFFES